MPGQTPKGDPLGGRRAPVPAAGRVVMSSADHAAGTNWMAPAQPDPDKSISCLAAFAPYSRNARRETPSQKFLPMRVTLDRFIATLAIAACRKR
jgi:hypothetical protein